MTLTFKEFMKLLLRLLGKGPKWHGNVNIKFYEGRVKHLTAEDSYDLESMESNVILDLSKLEELKNNKENE